ncbi:hypothetical protein EJB05_03316, partial [Eragrostis curvula]
MPSSERKLMEARYKDFLIHWQKTAKKRMTEFAVQGEERRKYGHRPVEPPFEIIKYPELLERAWGWDEILPYNHVDCWSLYKTYLQEYYKRNASAALLTHQMEHNAEAHRNLNRDDGNGLAALINLCINMESELLHLLKSRAQEFDVDEISLKDKLTNCAHQITNVECGGFPAPTIALKCIMAEAELLCDLLMRKTKITSDINISCRIRKFALRFMTYKGPECFAATAAATMMATTKEAKLICELRRNKCWGGNHRSDRIRGRTLVAMLKIREECSATEESTGGNSTATKLISDESDGNNCSEKDLVSKDNLPERNEINQNTMVETSLRIACYLRSFGVLMFCSLNPY